MMWHMAGRFSVRASTHGKHQTWNSLVKGLTNKSIRYYQGLMSWSFPMALLKTSWHIDCLGGLILSRFQNSTVPLNQRGSKVFKTQNDDGGPSWAWRPSWGFSTFKLLGTEWIGCGSMQWAAHPNWREITIFDTETNEPLTSAPVCSPQTII